MGFEDEVKKANFKGIITGAIISAFGFMVALSWNNTIKTTIDFLIPAQESLFYLYLSSIIITVVATTIAYFLVRVQNSNLLPKSIKKGLPFKKRNNIE